MLSLSIKMTLTDPRVQSTEMLYHGPVLNPFLSISAFIIEIMMLPRTSLPTNTCMLLYSHSRKDLRGQRVWQGRPLTHPHTVSIYLSLY